MRNTILKVATIVIGAFLLPSLAFAQLNTHQGGTGLVDVSSGSLLFGSTAFNIRLATSSALQFSNTLNRLTVTNASTTALTVASAYLSGISTGNCLQTSADGLITGTGSACSSGGAFPFTADTNFNQQVYSTSTPTLWFKSGMFASSTSWFNNAQILNSTSSISLYSASSTLDNNTFFKNATGTSLAIFGSTTVNTAFNAASSTLLGSTLFLNATGTNLAILGSSTVNGTLNAHALTIPTITSALLLNSSAGATGAYGGSNPCVANASVAFSISATGVITCGNAVPFEFTPTSWGNSTSTAIGFLNASNGIFANASSTLAVFQSASSTIGSLFASFATSTNKAVLTYFQAPAFGSTASTQIATGTVSVNAYKIASSSLAIGDGTVTHNLFAVHSMGATFASSSLAYYGAFGAAGSTTILLANPLHASTLRSFFCTTDVGTAWIAFGTGAATTTAGNCSSSGVTVNLSSTNTWTGRQRVYVEIGHSASSPNLITVTADVEDTN